MMVIARCLVHVRRRVRLWQSKFTRYLPSRKERQLFGPWVRFMERRYTDYDRTSRFNPDCRERAALLLACHLSNAQQRCLRKRGFFIVRGKTGRRYRLWARRQFPVELIDSTAAVWGHKPWLYCIHNDLSEGPAILPLADYVLELKLCLEAAEKHFLLTSNPTFEQGRLEKEELLRIAAVQTT
jgi:hypothetical protein